MRSRGIGNNTHRAKLFAEELFSIDALSFPFRSMQKLPDKGLAVSVCHFPFILYKDRIEICQEEGHGESVARIFFSFSKGYYGNFRYWFLCPNSLCCKRCRKLYLVRDKGNQYFFCRCCLNLAYRSQNKTPLSRLIDKKWKMIRKVGANSHCLFDSDKPIGMHRKTFNRLREKVESLHNASMREFADKFGMPVDTVLKRFQRY